MIGICRRRCAVPAAAAFWSRVGTALVAALFLWSPAQAASSDEQRAEADACSGKMLPLSAMSYSPFKRDQHPGRDKPDLDQMRADMRLLSTHTRKLRTYSSTGGLEAVIPIAAEFGLDVKVGLSIGQDDEHNRREIAAALELARQHRNISALYVGNETTLQSPVPAEIVARLVPLIAEVRSASPVPVTTGEFWHIWLKHPELVAAVDFLAAHILPFWEEVAADEAVDYTMGIIERLQKRYPDRYISVGEFGWPSAGGTHGKARAGTVEQAAVISRFVSAACRRGISYNIIEAFDQPWKTHEGPVGPHWGLFDVDRMPKPSVRGLVEVAVSVD